MDCGVDTSFVTGIGHYYTVHSHVWLQAVPEGRGHLCLHCLEKRLGRPLADDDFVATPFDILGNFSRPRRGRGGMSVPRRGEVNADRSAVVCRATAVGTGLRVTRVLPSVPTRDCNCGISAVVSRLLRTVLMVWSSAHSDAPQDMVVTIETGFEPFQPPFMRPLLHRPLVSIVVALGHTRSSPPTSDYIMSRRHGAIRSRRRRAKGSGAGTFCHSLTMPNVGVTSIAATLRQPQASDHTVKTVRSSLETTSRLAKLQSRVGADGKTRVTRKPVTAARGSRLRLITMARRASGSGTVPIPASTTGAFERFRRRNLLRVLLDDPARLQGPHLRTGARSRDER
jgi:hypothetical protein